MFELLDPAPDFTLPATGDATITLSDMRPSPVVLFFYPRDNTPGCTKEAIGFTEALAEFDALGVKIIGISKDDMASHEKFVAKKELGMPLVSDAEGDACERYGVWKEKKMYGKTFMGIERSIIHLLGGVRQGAGFRVGRHVAPFSRDSGGSFRMLGPENQGGLMSERPYVIDQMISAKSIAARIEELCGEIAQEYKETDKLVVVGLLRGSFVFIADRSSGWRQPQ